MHSKLAPPDIDTIALRSGELSKYSVRPGVNGRPRDGCLGRVRRSVQGYLPIHADPYKARIVFIALTRFQNRYFVTIKRIFMEPRLIVVLSDVSHEAMCRL